MYFQWTFCPQKKHQSYIKSIWFLHQQSRISQDLTLQSTLTQHLLLMLLNHYVMGKINYSLSYNFKYYKETMLYDNSTSTRISHNAFRITTRTPGSRVLYASTSVLKQTKKELFLSMYTVYFCFSHKYKHINSDFVEIWIYSPMWCNNR